MLQKNEACEPQLPGPRALEHMLCDKRSHHDEKPQHCSKEKPLLAAIRESLHAAVKIQCSQK